jgi:probable HAF family extracellular repeat protein
MNALPVYRNLTSIILAACCAFGIATAQAQIYTLTDLGVLPDETTSIPAAINQQGQVTGTSGNSAFCYSSDESTMKDIGTSGNNISHGFAINTSGQVVGDSTFGSEVSHATLFENGSSRDLADYGNRAMFSRANSINASGQVVGTFRATSSGEFARAFITNTSGTERRPVLTDLGTLGGPHAQALAINDSGFVTGNSETGDYAVMRVGITHAFLWNPATKGMNDLGVLGGDYSYGTGISANNHVVGYSTINGDDNRIHAFLHDGLAMRDLGSLDPTSAESDRSFALGVNSADQVVGYSYVTSSVVAFVYPPVSGPVEQVAFIYTQGMMRDLNTQIGNAAKRYRLYSATAINDQGQITAIAHDESSDSFHAVLLTPSLDIPIPVVKRRLVFRKSGTAQVSSVPRIELLKTRSGAISAK